MMTQEQFLSEHNRLSPLNLRATSALLARFREEKRSLFGDGEWCLEKLRRPFIMWLTALPMRDRSARAKAADLDAVPEETKSLFCRVDEKGKKI